jgi:hypothetical protein
VATGPSGDVVIAGTTLGVFPGRSGTPGRQYGFVRAYDPDGTARWTRQFAAEANGIGKAVAVDGRGLVHVAYGRGSAAVLRTYDPTGVKVATAWLKATKSAVGLGVAVGPNDTVYSAGEVWGRLPGRKSKGGFDGFIAKYRVR